MKLSTDRILTTHAGSLPRSPSLEQMLVARSRGGDIDNAALLKEIEESSHHIIRMQAKSGVDIGNNGEQAREIFYTYIAERLTGFENAAHESTDATTPLPKDIADFPDLIKVSPWREFLNDAVAETPYKISSEVRHGGLGPLKAECDQFKRIANEEKVQFVEPFMTASSPGCIGSSLIDEFYSDKDKLLHAIAVASRIEYEHIIAEGYVLQLDCPDLAMSAHFDVVELPVDEYLGNVEERINAINRALEGLPRDRVRMHVCWGNWEGPHTYDLPMSDLLPLVYKANVGAISLPFANPRHAHEWKLFKEMPLPDNMALVAGVIDVTTNYVEHPEVVAERIENVASAIGDPTRVIAGTDCGFCSLTGCMPVVEGVVWEKLKALRAGADLATKRLLG